MPDETGQNLVSGIFRLPLSPPAHKVPNGLSVNISLIVSNFRPRFAVAAAQRPLALP